MSKDSEGYGEEDKPLKWVRCRKEFREKRENIISLKVGRNNKW
jgi:hypothetical protein